MFLTPHPGSGFPEGTWWGGGQKRYRGVYFLPFFQKEKLISYDYFIIDFLWKKVLMEGEGRGGR